jgi:Tfp pilus assembly protein PilV
MSLIASARNHSAAAGPRRRAGFTLVELLVAILLLDILVLGTIATSALAVRRYAAGRGREQAVASATSRIELLRLMPCGTQASGTDSGPGMVGHWSVTQRAPHQRALRDSVTYQAPGGARQVLVEVQLPC